MATLNTYGDYLQMLNEAEAIVSAYYLRIESPLNAKTVFNSIRNGVLDFISDTEADQCWVALGRSDRAGDFHVLRGLFAGIKLTKSMYDSTEHDAGIILTHSKQTAKVKPDVEPVTIRE